MNSFRVVTKSFNQPADVFCEMFQTIKPKTSVLSFNRKTSNSNPDILKQTRKHEKFKTKPRKLQMKTFIVCIQALAAPSFRSGIHHLHRSHQVPFRSMSIARLRQFAWCIVAPTPISGDDGWPRLTTRLWRRYVLSRYSASLLSVYPCCSALH